MDYSTFQAHQNRGHKHRGRAHFAHAMSLQRAPVNIYKTADTYEMLVFAPGRKKELFRVNVEGRQLQVVYEPEQAADRPDWVRREYSRGWFERSFMLDEQIDVAGIKAEYTDGVLQVSLPLLPGSAEPRQEIPVS